MKKSTCPECGERIIGRSDKKFCSDYCRNSFNNKKNRITTKLLRDVNSILLKNHRILKNLYAQGITHIHRDKLLVKGYNFDFVTSIKTMPDNIMCYCSYDYGIFLENKVYYQISKTEDLIDKL